MTHPLRRITGREVFGMEPIIGIEIGRQDVPGRRWIVSAVHGPSAKTGRRAVCAECRTKRMAHTGQRLLMEAHDVPGWSTAEAASVGSSAEFKALVAETTWPRPLAENEADYNAVRSG